VEEETADAADAADAGVTGMEVPISKIA